MFPLAQLLAHFEKKIIFIDISKSGVNKSRVGFCGIINKKSRRINLNGD